MPNRRTRLGVRELILLIGCAAVGLWIARVRLDLRPETGPIRQLRSDDPGARLAAVEKLAWLNELMSSTEAASTLVQATADPDAGVRLAAISALGHYDPGAAGSVEALTARTRDPDPRVRESSLRMLAQFGPVAARAHVECVRALADPDPAVRRAAARATSATDRGTNSLVPTLLTALAREPDPRTRQTLLAQLVGLKPGRVAGSSLAIVLKSLGDPDAGVRKQAVLALDRHFGDPNRWAPADPDRAERIIRALAAALADRSAEVQVEATRIAARVRLAMRPLPFASVQLALDDALGQVAREGEPTARRAAAESLFWVIRGGTIPEGAIATFHALLLDPDPRLRQLAVVTYRTLADGLVRNASIDPDPQAVAALDLAIPRLIEALTDPDVSVRTHSYDALNLDRRFDPSQAPSLREPLRAATRAFRATLAEVEGEPRWLVISALGAAGPPDAAEAASILKSLRDHKDQDVRLSSQAALERLEGSAPPE